MKQIKLSKQAVTMLAESMAKSLSYFTESERRGAILIARDDILDNLYWESRVLFQQVFNRTLDEIEPRENSIVGAQQ